MDKSKNLTFCFWVHFLLKIMEKFSFQHYHCGAVACAKNLIHRSGTRYWKRHKLLIDLLRDLKTFDVDELVFQSDEFQFFFGSSTCSHVHVQSLDTCGQHEAGDCFFSLWIYRRSKVSETFQILLVLYLAGKWKFISPQDSYRGDY